MNIEGKTIWQQAGGDIARNYVRTNIEFDVILNGPGYAGRLPDCEKTLRADGWSSKKITDLKRFADEMRDGDIVVLRLGTSEVYAVGEVVGDDYAWMEEFGDIDGWDLQHVRRVRWLWTAPKEPQKFDVHALKMGDTTQRLLEGTVRSWLEGLSIPETAYGRPLALLPLDTYKEASLEEISEYLYDQGVSSSIHPTPAGRDWRTNSNCKLVCPTKRTTIRTRNCQLFGNSVAARARLDAAADGD